MAHLEVSHVGVHLPDGRQLLDDVTFRVGDGDIAALVGPNGAGKTTLLRVLAGDVSPTTGTVTRSGHVGVMRQFIGSIRDETTIRDLLLSLADEPVQKAAADLAAAELAMMETDDEPTQLRYASALGAWGDAGGYAAEVLWDTCTTEAFDLPLSQVVERNVATLSGGEQKRLALETLLRGHHDVLLLDEPDNYLDVAGKRWLERMLQETRKTVLFVSHDRELLANAANRIVSVEGGSAWVHGGGYATFHAARLARHERMDELNRRWDEEHEHLIELVRRLKVQASISPAMASRYSAAQTRLRKYEEAGPPAQRPPEQNIAMKLQGGRTGVRAVMLEGLALTGLTKPFDAELWYGDRVGVTGPNGTGKSHFLRLLAGEEVAHSGAWRLGARVLPGFFAQTHDTPGLHGKTLVELLNREAHDRGAAMARLRRYELDDAADQRFETLSGGQQARFQVLMLELGGATLLLLDEPTDNLDVASADALEDALRGFQGTVIAVSHDRWFLRQLDRFLVFDDDGRVVELTEPPTG